jgi:polysaccharide biosynthesis transport protein
MLSFVVAKLSTPSYVGTALVMIQPQQAIGTTDAITRAQTTNEIINTETFVLRSRALARDAIERLHLDTDPEFNPPPKPSRLLTLIAPVLPKFERLANWAQSATQFYFGAAPGPLSAGEEIEPTFKSDTEVVNAVLQRLRVAPQEQSNVIEVSFSSSNPETAASVPNALIEVYLERRRREAERELAEERKWLENVSIKLSGKLHESEAALNDYRQKSGLLGDKNPTLLEHELTETRARLAAARARTAEVNARLSQMQTLASSPLQPQSSTSAPATASEPLGLQRLREQAVQLHVQLAAISDTLGPNHPKTIQLQAQLRDLDNQIRREGSASLKAELSAAQAVEAALNTKVAEATRNFARINGDDNQLQTLMAVAEVDRKAYERYLALANEALGHTGNQYPGASLISAADIPSKPSFPNKRIIVLGGLTIGAGAGVALATLMELLRGGLRSMDQVEDALGVKCLGLVPRLKPSSRRRLRARELPRLLQRDHVFRQSVRTVEFKILNFDRDNSRVILVTAALPNEGKTSIAVSLAISLAADGFRVMLVDCDIHRPTVHRIFNGDRQPGLTDYLVHGTALEQIIHNDDDSGVDYIPAGTASKTCSITPDRLHALIDRLGRQYPFIILDSGPVLAVPETLALSQLADKTVLAVRWGRTPVTVARHAVAQLLDSGAEIAAVLSMFDLQRSAKHGDVIAGTYQQLERYHW